MFRKFSLRAAILLMVGLAFATHVVTDSPLYSFDGERRVEVQVYPGCIDSGNRTGSFRFTGNAFIVSQGWDLAGESGIWTKSANAEIRLPLAFDPGEGIWITLRGTASSRDEHGALRFQAYGETLLQQPLKSGLHPVNCVFFYPGKYVRGNAAVFSVESKPYPHSESASPQRARYLLNTLCVSPQKDLEPDPSPSGPSGLVVIYPDPHNWQNLLNGNIVARKRKAGIKVFFHNKPNTDIQVRLIGEKNILEGKDNYISILINDKSVLFKRLNSDNYADDIVFNYPASEIKDGKMEFSIKTNKNPKKSASAHNYYLLKEIRFS